LKSKKDIDTLFLSGKAFFVFPFKVFYRLIEQPTDNEPVVFGVSVPKKIFKRAVDRNAIKRKVREIYRVRKQELKDELSARQKTLHIMLVYIDRQLSVTSELTPVVADILKKVKRKCEDNPAI
jgi:ribonuclease P protein component